MEIEYLIGIAKLRTAAAQKVQRAKILILSSEGMSNIKIAEKLDIHRNLVAFLNILDEKYDEDKKIKIVFDNHSVHTSKETRGYLEQHPGRFEFVFTPKHGSWLNMIESLFGKFARVCLKGIRVRTKDELVQRIYQYMDEVNAELVVYRWKKNG